MAISYNDYKKKYGETIKKNVDAQKKLERQINLQTTTTSQKADKVSKEIQNLYKKNNILVSGNMANPTAVGTTAIRQQQIEKNKQNMYTPAAQSALVGRNNNSLGYLKEATDNKNKMLQFQQNNNELRQKENELKALNVDLRNEQKDKWYNKVFQTPKAFEDGYQFGDVSKTIGSTVGDLVANAAKGVTSLGDSAAKLITSGIAAGADLIGKDEYAQMLRDRIAGKDEKTNERLRKYTPTGLLTQAQESLNENSVSGDTLDKVAQGVGYTAGMAVAGNYLPNKGNIPIGRLNMPALAVVGGAAGGLEEAYQKGAKGLQAAAKATGSGLVEGITEGLFGMFGVGGNEITDELGKKIASNFESGVAKALAKTGVSATGESIEEFLSYSGNQLLDYLIDKVSSDNDPKFYKNWNWEEVGEEMAVAFLSSAIAQGGSTAINIRTTYNNAVREVENKLGRPLTTEEQQSLKEKVINSVVNEETEQKTDNSQTTQLEADIEELRKKRAITRDNQKQAEYTAKIDNLEQQLAEVNKTLTEMQQNDNLQQNKVNLPMVNTENKVNLPFNTLQQENSKISLPKVNATDTSYRGSHQIENAKPITELKIDDVVKKITNIDGYLTNQAQKDLTKLKKILNNSSEEITIYRASPVNELNDGDWVTTDRSYAQNVANNNGGKVYSYKVNANQLYYPDNVSELPSLHRLSSFQYVDLSQKNTQTKELDISKINNNLTSNDINEINKKLQASDNLVKELEYKTQQHMSNYDNVEMKNITELYDLYTGGGYRTSEQIKELIDAIKTNGITEPIKLAKNNNNIEIENGNHRLFIANKLGLNKVPVVYVESLNLESLDTNNPNWYNKGKENGGNETITNEINRNDGTSKNGQEYNSRYNSSIDDRRTDKNNNEVYRRQQENNNKSSNETIYSGTNKQELDNSSFKLPKNNNIVTSSIDKIKNPNIPMQKVSDILKVQAKNIAEQINKKGSFDLNQRSWIETSTESNTLKDKILIKDLDPDKINYVVQSNKKSLDSANKRLDTYGYEKTLDYVKNLLQNDGLPKASDVALMQRMIQEASKRGDVETAQDLIMDTAILGTDLGQATQALSIIKRLTPEGQLTMYTKLVQRAKSRGEKSFENVQITPEMVQNVLEAYKSDGTYDQEDLNGRVEKFKQDLADQMKSTAGEKIDAWRYLSMLGNPKTHIRNIVSNVAMSGTIKVKNAMARTLESILPVKERTKTWKQASQEIKNYAEKTANDMKGIITGENKYNEKSAIESKKQIFKNKAMEKLSNFNSNALEAEDWFFSKRAFQNNLQEYLTANGINTMEDIQNNPEIVEKAKVYAVEQAEIATFRQYSKLAATINQLEKKSKGAKLAIEALVPFKKTPINVAKAGVNYSPIGLIKSLSYDIYQLKQGNINASQFIDKLSQGLTGTSLTLLGYALAKAGILNGSGGDDKDDKYDKQLGNTGYSLKIGDNSYSISWLSPVAMPLLVGSNAYEQLEEDKEWDMNVVSDTLAKTLDPLNEMSFMQGLTNALQSYGSGTDKIKGSLESTAQNYVGQFFPTLFSQFAAVTDDKKRSTKASNDSKYKFGEQTVRSIMYKLPGLRQQLEVATDIWGNEKEQADNILQRAFESFIAPYSRSEDLSTELDKELKKIYNETGESGVIPSIPNAYIKYGNNTYRMSASDYTKYKKNYGQTAYKLLNETINSSSYKSLSSDEKAKVLKDLFGYSKYYANTEYFKNTDVSYENKEYTKPAAYSKVGNVVNYYLVKTKDFEADKDKNGKSISGSAKKKAINYINSLKASIPEKAMLIKLNNYSFDDYNNQIVQYINSQKISKSEKEQILKQLKFTIKDGRVYW